MTIACYRMTRIISPLSPRWQHPARLIMALWLFSILIMSVAPVLYGTHTTYSAAGLTCSFVQYKSAVLTMITFVIFFCVPMVTIVGANIVILAKFVRSSRDRDDRIQGKPKSTRKATVTISLICWIYIISYIPSALLVVLYMMKVQLPRWSYVSTQYALALNVIANPIIYTMTNRRFADFVQKLFVKSDEGDWRNSTMMSILSRKMSGAALST